MAENQETKAQGVYKDTLNLPQTNFPIRPLSKETDPHIIKRWNSNNLFKRILQSNEGKETFILHDGPPYANGNIHIGHAYNKILKDIVTKSQRMMGKYVPIIPGWDCHGLPIEIKVSKEFPDLSRTELKQKCRAYAQEWIDTQREQFKALGVIMDWDHYYATMEYSYEASIIKAFAAFVAEGYIDRNNKTVPWCYSCQTVLATAEIEYQDRKDPSIYVAFPLAPDTQKKLFPQEPREVSFVVWTTTPWTLPLNRAVLLKPESDYALISINDSLYIVGASRVDALSSLMKINVTVLKTINASQFVHSLVQHPFIDELLVPLIADPSVSLEDGTAAVHCAPGAGPEDYAVGIKNNLLIYSPVGADGRYTKDVQPKELENISVADGQIWVIKELTKRGRLVYKTSLRHSYPHCWRCHNGLIFRATKQWFCNLEKNNLKDSTLEAIQKIKTVPENSKNRLTATVDGRLEWCLSRQRVWGTPIIALLCNDCDSAIVTQALLSYAANHIAKHGIEWWDTVSLEELKKIEPFCTACSGSNLEKEKDILDVWFDSGISHQAVLKKENQFPADMYLEGKDQHRGWFQSSLLTSMALEHKPSMKTIMTHGFTVDEQGRKMSKSLGNTVSPQEMIDRLSTDGLRLWAAMIDCSGEAVVSDVLLNNVQQVYRKIRNTARFLLSVLYDYQHERDKAQDEHLHLLDQYALQECSATANAIINAYASYNFTAVAHKLGDYCASSLSALYLDIIKDRLYCDQADGQARRSAQTACYIILDTLTTLCAPIFSITSELIFDEYKDQDNGQSIHERLFVQPNYLEQDVVSWQLLLELRSAFLKAIEGLREAGLVKHSLEAIIIYSIDPATPMGQLLQKLEEKLGSSKLLDAFLKELLIVSSVARTASTGKLFSTSITGLKILVERVNGNKCPRCWHWTNDNNTDYLCNRCACVVEKVLQQ